MTATYDIPVLGATIHAVEDGSPEGVPLLLFNGAYCRLGMWTPVLGRLAGRFRVIRHDYRGTGLSTPASASGQYTLDRYSEDVAAVLAKLGADRVVVWGMAYGSRVALNFAAAHGDRVQALVLSDASVDEADPPAQREGAKVAARRRRALGLPEPVREPEWFESRDRPSAQLSYGAGRQAGQPEQLDRYGGPVLVATGEHDPNLASSRRMVERLADAELAVLDHVGHGSVLQRPGLCADVVLDFLDRRL